MTAILRYPLVAAETSQGLAPETIKPHVKNIFTKLNVIWYQQIMQVHKIWLCSIKQQFDISRKFEIYSNHYFFGHI